MKKKKNGRRTKNEGGGPFTVPRNRVERQRSNHGIIVYGERGKKEGNVGGLCEFRVSVEKRRGHLCVRWKARSHQSLSSLVRNRRQVFTFPREWCTPRIGIYVGRRTFLVDASAPLFHAAFDLSRLGLSIVV